MLSYDATFYQKNWNVVGDEVTKAILSFFSSGKLLQQIKHTFITLVPKSPKASSLSDYRPISCCNALYKIISKVLSNIFKHVIAELVSVQQSAFIKNRLISDASLLANELVRDLQ